MKLSQGNISKDYVEDIDTYLHGTKAAKYQL